MLIVIIKDRDLTDHKWNGAGWSILFTIRSIFFFGLDTLLLQK